MKTILFAGILITILLLGCVQQGADNDTNTKGDEVDNDTNAKGADIVKAAEIVEKGDSIEVEYRGRLENGEVFDASANRGTPLAFVAGAGQMIPGFDSAVLGMKFNEEKTVTLPPEEAYGEEKPELIAEISKENFDDSWDTLKIGAVVSNSGGYPGKIIDLNTTTATVNFNHELAGKTLIFWIKVVRIEKP